jgi:preprotein translocase subunit SecE
MTNNTKVVLVYTLVFLLGIATAAWLRSQL